MKTASPTSLRLWTPVRIISECWALLQIIVFGAYLACYIILNLLFVEGRASPYFRFILWPGAQIHFGITRWKRSRRASIGAWLFALLGILSLWIAIAGMRTWEVVTLVGGSIGLALYIAFGVLGYLRVLKKSDDLFTH